MIHRRTMLLYLGRFFASTFLLVYSACATSNIIIIMADDMGYECIGANGGSSYATPNIDQMAAEGMRFEHCYSNPACTPSRVQIMTGLYNVYNYTRFAQLKRGETTFANLLKDAGYATCIAGKWQLGQKLDAPQNFGFDQSLLWQHTRGNFTNATKTDTRYVNPQLERNGVQEEYHNGEFGPDVIVDFIGAFIQANKEEPFLVYYPMLLPHSPFVPNPDSDDWNPKSKGAKRGSMDPNYFDDMVRYTDKMVGRIMQQVKDAGLADNTYLFFTSDNGSLGNTVSQINGKQIRGGKGKTTNAGTHVPFVVVGPGVPAGQVNDDLVDFTDFLPTFCEIAGVKIEKDTDLNGLSLLSQLHGDDNHRREFIYCWYQIPSFMKKNFPGVKDLSFVRNQRYKLYRDGSFYDVGNDILEKNDLSINELNQELSRVRDQMFALIEKHDAIRAE